MSSAISVMFSNTVLQLWNVLDKIWVTCHSELASFPGAEEGAGKEANSVPALSCSFTSFTPLS